MARRVGFLDWLIYGGAPPPLRGKRASSTRARAAAAPKPARAVKALKPASEKAARLRARSRPVPSIYSDAYTREVLAGKHGPDALRKLLRTATTAKRNPAGSAARSALDRIRAAAERQSARFHGSTFRDVVELTRDEQRRYGLPRWVVPIGTLRATEYVPPAGSQRAGSIWRHRAGDRGAGRPSARRLGLLVADPRNGRTVQIGGSERFDPSRGLVG